MAIKSLEDAIAHCIEVAEMYERDAEAYTFDRAELLQYASEHRQLAEWLRELKAYKGLSTYNRPNKCNKCEYEDSEYYCDDCIWNFVDKFKQREVNADECNL